MNTTKKAANETMISPSVEELTKGGMNRYALCMATAKTARLVTDEYVAERNDAEQKIANKETDKPLSSLIDADIRDKKAVRNAITRIVEGDIKIELPKA